MKAQLISIILGLLVLFMSVINLEVRGPEVIFLNVGQGDSMLYTNKNFQILVDAGGNDNVANKLGKYMYFNDKTIEYLVITHYHYDHFGGLVSVLDDYKVENIVLPVIVCKENMYTNRLRELVEKEGSRILTSLSMKQFEMDVNAYSVSVKSCVTSQADVNNSSLITRIKVNDITVLNLGDLEENVENKVKGSDVQILKVGHHCADTSSSLEVLKTLNPIIAICSVGKNSYGHPSSSVLQRFSTLGIKYFLTKDQGDIRFNIRRKVIYNEDNKIIYRL